MLVLALCSAYTSFLVGRVAQWAVPDLVALHTSRGHESTKGKVRQTRSWRGV